MTSPSQEPPASSKSPNEDLKDTNVLCTVKSRERAKIRNMGVTRTSDHIQIKIKIPNTSQEPPASSKGPKQDLKDRDVLCTFEIKIEGQNSEHECTIDQQPYANQDKAGKP